MISARSIAEGLGGKPSGSGWICRCPAHDDRNPSFSVGHGPDGRLLVKCFAGCSQEAVIDALRRRELWPSASRRVSDPAEFERERRLAQQRRSQAERQRERQDAWRIRRARELWHAAKPLEPGDLAYRYLCNRLHAAELCTIPPTLRQGVWTDRKTGQAFVSLVAAIAAWPEREVRAVQVTKLDEPGVKAAGVEVCKQVFGPFSGGAVRLAPWREGARLALAEGVEDALALALARPDLVPWAILGTANARHVQVPDGAELVMAFDGDQAGRKARGHIIERLGDHHPLFEITMPEKADPLSVFLAWNEKAGAHANAGSPSQDEHRSYGQGGAMEHAP